MSVIRAGDAGRYGVNIEDDLIEIATEAHEAVINNSLNLDHRKIVTNKGREIYLLEDYKTLLALRAAAKAISKQLKIKVTSRDKIVRGVLEGLFDATPNNIIRCDFSGFYESIDSGPVITELLNNTRTHPHVKSVLNQILKEELLQPSKLGIPRGLGLSAVIAEMRLKKFDNDVRLLPGVYRYFRFSDDFIVFTINDSSSTQSQIIELIGADLSLNLEKTKLHTVPTLNASNKTTSASNIQMDFLGYKFIIQSAVKFRNARSIRVTISDKKIAKRKTRIIIALKDFKKSGNADLLLRRIQILTSNMSIRRSGHDLGPRAKRVKTGIYYHYRACGTYESINNRPVRDENLSISELKHLDGFLHSLLWRRGSEFYVPIKNLLSENQKETLKRYSFHKGYEKKMTLRLTRAQAAEARRVWRNA